MDISKDISLDISMYISMDNPSMRLPKMVGLRRFFAGKNSNRSKKVCICMVFYTFRLIFTQKPSKSFKSWQVQPKCKQILVIPCKSYLNIDLAGEVSTFLTKMSIWHESGEGKVPKLREGCLKRGRRCRGDGNRMSQSLSISQ